jgi:hypothetical protein
MSVVGSTDDACQDALMGATNANGGATLRWLAHGLLVVALFCFVAGCGSGDSDPKVASITTASGPQPTVSGTTFRDPQGAYTITVPDTWTENSGALGSEIEGWFVAPRAAEFSANVNVITQAVPGLDLEEYLDGSLDAAPKQMEDFRLVSRGFLTSTSGSRLGALEYTGRTSDRDLHFLVVFGVRNGHAVAATLTALPADFARLRGLTEPYLRTLALL